MNNSPTLRLVVLGSGSSGNATAITDGSTTVLVDCGFSASETARRLASAGIEAASVSAILLTHEHADHIKGLDVFCRRHAPGCSVYATHGTLRAAGLLGLRDEVLELTPGETVRIGSLDVVGFRTSHDAAEPVGYRICSGSDCVGLATDTGHLTAEAAEGLEGCRILALESNHDVRMLERGPYPSFLKRRILSDEGHLSNAAAADALEKLLHDRLTHVVAMHRSETNNTSALATSALQTRLDRLGVRIKVSVAPQRDSLDTSPPQGELFGPH